MYIIKQVPEDFIVDEIPNFKESKNGRYTYFLLKKRDFTTEGAIQLISRNCRIERRRFGYAGSKDRSAVTTQVCSVSGPFRGYSSKDIEATTFGRGDEPVSLGSLKGNRFTIIVRNIKRRPSPIGSIVNYFDEQRFGRSNFQAGLAILRNDFKGACSHIDQEGATAHLASCPGDCVGAIRKIPLKTRMMYINAVQSHFWNCVASGIIKKGESKYKSVKYSLGEFLFPAEDPKNIKIPLLSFDTEIMDLKIRQAYDGILKKAILSLRSFVIRQMPEMTVLGSERDLVAPVNELKVSELTDDNLNPGMKKVKLCFELQKGSYATIAVKRMFLF